MQGATTGYTLKGNFIALGILQERNSMQAYNRYVPLAPSVDQMDLRAWGTPL